MSEANDFLEKLNVKNIMKTKIHPKYHGDAIVTCACGAVTAAGSTIKEQQTDICSKCHPFYTGKQKLVDTAGRVDKFRARMKAAESHASKKKSSDNDEDEEKTEKTDEKYMTIDDIKSIQKTGSKKPAAEKKAAAEKKPAAKKKAVAKKPAAKKPASKAKKSEK